MDSGAQEVIGLHWSVWAVMIAFLSWLLRRGHSASARRFLCSCGGSTSLNEEGAACASAVDLPVVLPVVHVTATLLSVARKQ